MRTYLILSTMPLKNMLELKDLETGRVAYFKPSVPVTRYRVGEHIAIKVTR